MPRFRLSTLLILSAALPPLLAGAWFCAADRQTRFVLLSVTILGALVAG